jgi:hypothetical protein
MIGLGCDFADGLSSLQFSIFGALDSVLRFLGSGSDLLVGDLELQ